MDTNMFSDNDQILNGIQEGLKNLNGRTEIKSTEEESLLAGKFERGGINYKIMVHIIRDDVEPKTHDAGFFDQKKSGELERSSKSIPSLSFQSNRADYPHCSPEEGQKIKQRVLKEVRERLSKQPLFQSFE